MRGNMQKAPALKGRSFLAAGEGFEPSHTESESAVLPLHNPAISQTQGLLYPISGECQAEFGKFSLNFFYFFARQSMETLSPVHRKNKTPSRTGIPSSRVSAAA